MADEEVDDEQEQDDDDDQSGSPLTERAKQYQQARKALGAGKGAAGAAEGAAGAAKTVGTLARAGAILASPWVWGTLLVILGLAIVVALFFWLLNGDVNGQKEHQGSTQQSADNFMAYAGDPASLRKMILENSEKIKQDLADLKSRVNALQIDSGKKDDANKKIDQVSTLVDEAKKLLGNSSAAEIPKAAEDKLKQIGDLVNEVKNVLNMPAYHGDFALPLGALTCVVKNNPKPHTAEPLGHGWYYNSGTPNGGAYDYFAPDGSSVYAVTSGEITLSKGPHPKWGNYWVYLKSDDGKIMTVYAHIRPAVSPHEHVNKGQVIGQVMTGTLKKPHLQFEICINDHCYKEAEQLTLLCEK